jgi:single-strand DNA-binding protein
MTGGSIADGPHRKRGHLFMNSLNNILLEGNLVKDPQLRSTPKGTPVCTLRLASNRYYKQDTGFEKETGFFEVETWSKLAEHCYNLAHKGQGVRVTGRLKQDRWTGQDGKLHSKVTIVAEHVSFKPEFNRNTYTAGETGALAEEAEGSFDGTGQTSLNYAGVQETAEVEAAVF